jgi:hypothetical protein
VAVATKAFRLRRTDGPTARALNFPLVNSIFFEGENIMISDPQLLHPRWLVVQLGKWECPMRTVAALVCISGATISQWVTQGRPLSVEAQIQLLLVVEFIDEMRSEFETVPINFSDAAALRPRFVEFLRRRVADGVVGVPREAEAPQVATTA